MMEACLGVPTCDKCREPMEKGQHILVIAEGTITEVCEENDELTFEGKQVRFACHLSCWDNYEDPM